ncbi:G protein-coupled receptor 89 [Mycena maculata]|uniref:G protein-coupled receptor 89 n=1 Tax=Mycena maculata TaxID=230809 RepID=A0AAD7HRS4_9AGAR|nr:G protein-coupled receptor 89 [Mycena maculata]
MSVELLTETGILVILRATIFFSCRKYLLRSLYSDLQDLSGVERSSSKYQRDPLPSPITQTSKEFSSSRRPQGRTETLYSTLSSNVFAGCFSESCMLFLLLMLQGLSMFSSSTRLFNWRLSLFLLLAYILVVVPFLLSLLLTVGPDAGSYIRSTLPRFVFSTICVALYVFLLSLIPLPPALSSPDIISATLSRLVVLGTIILGLLSGFGAVSSSWDFIPSRKTVTTPTEQDVVTAEYALSGVRDDLERKREEARRRAAQQAEGTWISRVMPSFRGDENLQELKGLEALEYEMSRSLDALRQRRASDQFSHTFRGRLTTIGGRLFALYCALRFVTSFINIFFPPTSSSPTTSYPDVVTETVAELLAGVSPRVQFDDVARAMRHLSLMLVGVIILSSIRLVLRSVTRALRLPSRNLGASLMLLLLAQLMVIYLLSTIVQLRASFPPPPPSPFSPSSYSSSTGADEPVNLFTTIPAFTLFGFIFDAAFLLAASASLIVRWAADRVNGPHV